MNKTVDFTSREDIYLKEIEGKKPNTVRRANIENLAKIMDATHIRIHKLNFKTSFLRTISDVTIYDHRIIISWKKKG